MDVVSGVGRRHICPTTIKPRSSSSGLFDRNDGDKNALFSGQPNLEAEEEEGRGMNAPNSIPWHFLSDGGALNVPLSYAGSSSQSVFLTDSSH